MVLCEEEGAGKRKYTIGNDRDVEYRFLLALRCENSPIPNNHSIDRPVVIANRNRLG